ncbi:leucyl aminopeptidase family protein [Virgifigura deserti]|uniref:leucyl aminopeptidase family protein n=1 Tax=Virgifigura deserti TaxID=2268457 RepID=UPI003CCC2E1F
MLDCLIPRAGGKAVALLAVTEDGLKGWLRDRPSIVQAWVRDTGFTAKPGSHILLPDADGSLSEVLVGVEQGDDIWSFAGLPGTLPEGDYRLDADVVASAVSAAALGWALGCYAFTRYRKPSRRFARLVWPKQADRAMVERTAEAIYLVRDLINTPAEDMGPADLAEAAQTLGRAHKAKTKVIVGDALLKARYPAIHAVGRASSRPPHLIDLRWGGAGPRVTLVGKGVCFDSGGLDLKSSGNMLLMKKDMGGAAHVLGLAKMIMMAALPVRLRVLIPAVENSVSGNAFRPLDVLRTRKGVTVEVGNTDAEGRLVLCDALAEADTEKPDLLIDCATLTGAARVALGTELPALFANDDAAAETLLRHGIATQDLLWRLPLHKPYRRHLDSKVADLNNVSSGSFGGAITAALFLAEFVGPTTPWLHLDMMAWNTASRPGRPEGGEAMGLRALYGLIAERAAKTQGKLQGPKTPGRQRRNTR